MIDFNWISPVEEYDSVYYKRDDLFSPFDNGINGGKVRQALSLISNNLKLIQEKYNNTVITTTNIDSPQGVIIATICNHFNIKCIVGYGTKRTPDQLIENNHLAKKIDDVNGEVRIIAKVGYTSVLNKALTDIIKEKNYFLIKFGINSNSNQDSIFGVIEQQVINMPKDLDMLVIPVGSGLIFSGILRGILKYNNIPKRIVGVLSGMDSKDDIHKYLTSYNVSEKGNNSLFSDVLEYELIKSDLGYHKKKYIDKPFEIDPIYESKSLLWLNEQNITDKLVMMWIVGNQRKI